MLTADELNEEVCNYCGLTDYGTKNVNTNQHNMCEGRWCEDAYENYKDEFLNDLECNMKHTKVIFNKPATIVIWEDDTKTVVKCNKNDKFKKKMGFLIAYFQKTSGLSRTESSKVLKEIRSKK